MYVNSWLKVHESIRFPQKNVSFQHLTSSKLCKTQPCFESNVERQFHNHNCIYLTNMNLNISLLKYWLGVVDLLAPIIGIYFRYLCTE